MLVSRNDLRFLKSLLKKQNLIISVTKTTPYSTEGKNNEYKALGRKVRAESRLWHGDLAYSTSLHTLVNITYN